MQVLFINFPNQLAATFISLVLSLVISIVKIKVRSGNIPENMRNILSFISSYFHSAIDIYRYLIKIKTHEVLLHVSHKLKQLGARSYILV